MTPPSVDNIMREGGRSLRGPLRWGNLTALYAFLAGCIGFLVNQFGYNFLLHADYTDSTLSNVVLTGAGAVGLFGASFVVFFDRRAHNGRFSWHPKMLVLTVGIFLMYSLGTRELLHSGLLASAAINGSTVSHEHIVTGKIRSQKTCKRGLTFDDLPSFWNRLCGVSEDQWNAIEVGQKLIVTGTGNQFGTIPKTFRYAN